jgi:iron complex transport system ATP-binding protein
VSEINSTVVTGDESVPALALDHIVFRRDGTLILDDVSFHVRAGDRWVVLGANGSGKSTLLRIAAVYEHPSQGTVRVLGETLGRTDVRVLRRRVGYNSASLSADLRPSVSAVDVVMTAKYAALEPWWHQYTDADRERAVACLVRMGVGRLADRPLATLSTGERQRVLLARTLMNDPGVILLDEPSAGASSSSRRSPSSAVSPPARRSCS